MQASGALRRENAKPYSIVVARVHWRGDGTTLYQGIT